MRLTKTRGKERASYATVHRETGSNVGRALVGDKQNLWDIEDIVLEIVGLLCRKDQLVLSRTCRDTWHISNIVIWHTIPDMCCLLQVLSPDIKLTTDYRVLLPNVFQGDPGSVLWGRLKLYTGNIREIRIYVNTQHLPSLQDFAKFSPLSEILPNLQSLRVVVSNIRDTQAAINLLPWVTSQSITRLDLDLFRGIDNASAIIRAFCVVASQGLEKLTHLGIATPPHKTLTPEAVQCLSTLIRRYPNLQFVGLSVSRLDVFTLLAAPSQVSHLSQLHVEIVRSSKSREVSPPLTDIAFHNLHLLQMMNINDTTPDLLPLVNETLSGLQCSAPTRGLSCKSLLLDIGRFSNLRSAHLLMDSDALNQDSMGPLLRCRKLESVELHQLYSPSRLTDEEVLTMAQSWPDLHRLILFCEIGPPQITLRRLGCLAVHCQYLRTLRVAVDATAVGISLPNAPPRRALRELDLRDSRIGGTSQSHHEVAAFISQVWPNLDFSSIAGHSFSGNGFIARDGWRDIWTTVQHKQRENLDK